MKILLLLIPFFVLSQEYSYSDLLDLGYEVYGMIRRQSVSENQTFRIQELNNKVYVLNSRVTKFVKNKVVKIKLNEAINSIDKFCNIKSKNVKDNIVTTILRYYELLKELKSE